MSAPPVMIPIPPNIATLTAPLILGELFSIYLFGVLSVQVYIYYLTFPKDANYIKAFVYIVFLIELTSSAMCISDTYRWFASGFGNLLALNDVLLSPIDTPLTIAIVAAAVQMFYCYRMYTINKKSLWISAFVAVLALTQVCAGIYSAVVAERAGSFSQAEAAGKAAGYVLYISSAISDIVIAVTMITLLLSSRQKVRAASNPHTSFIIRKVINVIIETNVVSASLAIITVTLLVALPGTNYFTCPGLILGRVYSNSLLLILNNRHYLTTVTDTDTAHSNGLFKRIRDDTTYPNTSSSGGGYYSKGTVRVELDTITDGATTHHSFGTAR